MKIFIMREVFISERYGYLRDGGYLVSFWCPLMSNPVHNKVWQSIKNKQVSKDTIYKLFTADGTVLDSVVLVPTPITPIARNQL